MYHPTQERARRQNDSPGTEFCTITSSDTTHAPRFHDKVGYFTFNDLYFLMGFHFCKHTGSVYFSICLRSRTLYRRAFTSVQQSKLYTCVISHSPHNAVKCVNFPDQMTFTQTANRWITGHRTDRLARHSDQGSCCAHTRCGVSGFGAGMSASDYYDVKMFHVKQPLFTKTETCEYLI